MESQMAQNVQQGVPAVPYNPMVDKEGVPSPQWYSFFVSLWTRTGGANGTISNILDNITNVAGSMLYRGANLWTGLAPGVANQVLTFIGGLPVWGLLNGSNFAPVSANTFLAGPSLASSAAETPNFRTIASADLDALSGQYPGESGATAAAAGNIGELVSASVAVGSAIALTSTVISDIASISLSPGDWNVWANVAVTAEPTSALAWINTASATDPTAPNGGAYLSWGNQTLASPVGMLTLQLAATTTVYLSIKATFGSPVSAYGFIGARRTH